jgi:hypothetical protein
MLTDQRRRRQAEAWRRWVAAAVIAAVLFGVYMANRREIGASDTVPAVLLPVTILRGDGIRLERFRHLWPDTLPYYVLPTPHGLVSGYPLGAALFALPTTAVLLPAFDRADPAWDQGPRALATARRMGKISAAAIAALIGAAVYLWLRALGLDAVALPATLIAALGSNLWMTASQSLWQHGPAALALTIALLLLAPARPGRLRLMLAGIACAAVLWCRPQDAVLALFVLLGVVRRDGIAALRWFLPVCAVLSLLLIAYNLYYFGRLLGGYGAMMTVLSPASHGNTTRFGEDIGGAALGTILSPSHGLFVFSPWIPLVSLMLPWLWQRIRADPLIATMIVGLPVFFVAQIVHSTWWAGWSFGPRYWTDAMPILAVVLAFALDWARRRPWPVRAAIATAATVSIAVQVIGAWCYPSSFEWIPDNIDLHHERLWNWRDTELTRCLRQGPYR